MKTPFHRKVLPWMFAIIFLMMAPALVFYTSGYRWNPKKNVIERNGTLIIDTQPTGASIQLNGKTIPETTSVTLQDMAPGSYDIDLNLKGYHPWSKTLWIEPERVTFASGIILWPQLEPQYIGDLKIENLFSDADLNLALAVVAESSTSTIFATLDQKTGQLLDQAEAKERITANGAEWNPHDSRQVLVSGQASGTAGYWLVQFTPPSVTKLPAGSYHWQSDGLLGQTSDYQLTIHSDQTVSRQPRPAGLKDVLDDWRLKELPQASGLILTQGDNAKEGSILPPGQWQLWSFVRNRLLLKDQEHWLWVDTKSDSTPNHEAEGQWPLPITVKRLTQYAFKNNNEAWIWMTDQDPELIYRQSDPLVSVSWHSAGNDLMVATKNEIMMFSLDARNGRNQTVLADFDEIQDAIVFDDAVFVTGKKGGQTGLWRLPLTLKSNSLLPLSIPNL